MPWSGVTVKTEQDILPEDIALGSSACHNYTAVAATTEPQVQVNTEQYILPDDDIALESSAGHNYTAVAATTEPQVQVNTEQEILPDDDIALESSAGHNYTAVAATTEPQVQVKVEQDILPVDDSGLLSATTEKASQLNIEFLQPAIIGPNFQVQIEDFRPLDENFSLINIVPYQSILGYKNMHVANDLPTSAFQNRTKNLPTSVNESAFRNQYVSLVSGSENQIMAFRDGNQQSESAITEKELQIKAEDIYSDESADCPGNVPAGPASVVQISAVQHMQSIYQNHSCTLCQDKFFYRKHLTEHLLQKHGVISCPKKVRKSQKSLKAGTSKSLTSVILSENACLHCSDKFSEPKQLLEHLLNNHRNLPHVCTFCEAKFPCKGTLKLHIKLHSSQTANQLTKLHSQLSVKKSPARKNIPCQFCLEMFSNGNSLQAHLFSKHPLGVKLETRFNRVQACQFCAEKFSSTKNLRDHLFEQHPPDFECEHCPSKFRSQEMLDAHVKKHEEKPKVPRAPYVKKWKCCGQSFITEEALEAHVKTHKVAPLMHCNECLKVYRCKKAMSQHIMTHFECHRCKVCGKKFVTHANLKRHKLSCEQPLELECMECGEEFQSKNTLSSHMDRMHYAKYKCSHCGKGFHSSTKRDDHVRTHTGEKPFSCETCQRRFYSKLSLQNHESLHHISTKEFECDFCQRIFKSKQYLAKHVVIHDLLAKKFICKYCDAAFTRRKCWKDHLVCHTGVKRFQCKTCHVRFTHVSGLRLHVKKFHSKVKMRQYPCTQCEKSFLSSNHLKRHVYTHTGERPHGCDLCDLKFAQASQLLTHKLMKHKVLPYECKKCGQRFKRIAEMMKHSVEHKAR